MSALPPLGIPARPSLTVYLAAPRGFCAGVDRAIQMVELALAKYGPPVYVRHEIVHNRFVVESLKAKGAVFVEELRDIPQTTQPVVFSAHGVARSVQEEAVARGMLVLDAACPLVSKVHLETRRHYEDGLQILLIGHAGHPEVVGTMGQLPAGAIVLVESVADAHALQPKDPDRLAFVTQTTLSVDDTAEIVSALRSRFPKIAGPHKEDICYATTNRQTAVKAIAPDISCLLVVGSPQSSNSMRLVEVAQRAGCDSAFLIEKAGDIPWQAFAGAHSIGVTAGASAPEELVAEVIDALKQRYDVRLETVTTAREAVAFNVPRELRTAAAS